MIQVGSARAEIIARRAREFSSTGFVLGYATLEPWAFF